MNIFEKAIRKGNMRFESELKGLFRTLAKKTHTDAGIAGAAGTPGAAESTDAHFIILKNDFDSARILLREFKKGEKKAEHTMIQTLSDRSLSRDECIDIFIMPGRFNTPQLVAESFTMSESISVLQIRGIKSYRQSNTLHNLHTPQLAAAVVDRSSCK